jgi:hypothetical protein
MHAMRVDPKGRKVCDLLDTIGEEPGEGTTYNTANMCSSIFATRPKPVQTPDLELYIHTCYTHVGHLLSSKLPTCLDIVHRLLAPVASTSDRIVRPSKSQA